MGRSRSRSYSPPPRRRRYMDDGPRRDGWHRTPPCSLLVRNISRDARPDDVRLPFERFGHVKDVYLPKDYYTGEPRGFGFVQYVDPADAAEAKYQMDHTVIGGREITVVFAEENRKKPSEMRTKGRSSRGSSWGGGGGGGGGGGRYGGGFRRFSPPRSPGYRYRSRSRSRSPPRRRYSPKSGSDRYNRSVSPPRGSGSEPHSPSPRSRHGRSRNQSSPPSARRAYSPEGNGHAAQKTISHSPPPRGRSYSRSPSHE